MLTSLEMIDSSLTREDAQSRPAAHGSDNPCSQHKGQAGLSDLDVAGEQTAL